MPSFVRAKQQCVIVMCWVFGCHVQGWLCFGAEAMSEDAKAVPCPCRRWGHRGGGGDAGDAAQPAPAPSGGL